MDEGSKLSAQKDPDNDPLVALYGGKTSLPLPPSPPFLWSSSLSVHEDKELRFSGFEPCYIACIKNLEWQLKRKCQDIDLRSMQSNQNSDLAEEMRPLLVKYSELLDALEKIESKGRVFEEDYLKNSDGNNLVRYAGQTRRISRAHADSDRVHEHLRNNVILIVLGYIYTWDVADNLKKRFGNLTTTLDRFLVGLAGGVSLLVPMILMTFLTGRTPRLIIVSVATLLFAGTVSFTTASREAVVGSTAAYAAIMVVYIGASDTVYS